MQIVRHTDEHFLTLPRSVVTLGNFAGFTAAIKRLSVAAVADAKRMSMLPWCSPRAHPLEILAPERAPRCARAQDKNGSVAIPGVDVCDPKFRLGLRQA